MTNATDNFLDFFKSLISESSTPFSDVRVEIVELNDTASGSEDEEGEVVDVASSFPKRVINTTTLHCHSVILKFNSHYFSSALSFTNQQHGDNTSLIRVEALPGQGELAVKLIRSFYDPSEIERLELEDYSAMMGVADMLLCERQLALLLDMAVMNFTNAKKALQGALLMRDKCGTMSYKVKEACLPVVVAYFCPLEDNVATHADFLSLPYDTLLALLRSGERLAYSEQSLLTFLLMWFNFDVETRCTEGNFCSLFGTILRDVLTTEYLHDEVYLKFFEGEEVSLTKGDPKLLKTWIGCANDYEEIIWPDLQETRNVLKLWDGFGDWYKQTTQSVQSDSRERNNNEGKTNLGLSSTYTWRNYIGVDEPFSYEGWKAGGEHPFGKMKSVRFEIDLKHSGCEHFDVPSIMLVSNGRLQHFDAKFCYHVKRKNHTEDHKYILDTDTLLYLKYACPLPRDVVAVFSIKGVGIFFTNKSEKLLKGQVLPAKVTFNLIVCNAKYLDACKPKEIPVLK